MNLADVRAGLAGALEGAAVRTYDTFGDQVVTPCATILLGAGQYDDDIDGIAAEYTVLILVSRADDASAQRLLDVYITSTVPAAIRSDSTLNGSVDSARVVKWDQPGSFTIGAISYAGVEVTVEVVG